jgi:hypothetical protein
VAVTKADRISGSVLSIGISSFFAWLFWLTENIGPAIIVAALGIGVASFVALASDKLLERIGALWW